MCQIVNAAVAEALAQEPAQHIEVFGETETVHHVTKRARCSRCKVKGWNTFRIAYVGEGWHALEGARG